MGIVLEALKLISILFLSLSTVNLATISCWVNELEWLTEG